MSKVICDNINFVKQLCNRRGRKQLLKRATKSNIRSLCEICLNVIRGNVPLDQHSKNKLKKHREHIETLAKKSVSLRKKKNILVNQRGGFAGLLASLALPVVASIVSGALKKNIKKKNNKKRTTTRK